MGEYRIPSAVKLLVGVLARDSTFSLKVEKEISLCLGPIDLQSDPIPFHWTHYYEKELGENPMRYFYSIGKLIKREDFPQVKRRTNELEKLWTTEGFRQVNIDPGYLTLGQYFLASTKDQRQRVYVGDNIFVEPTLYYKDSQFHPFDWTYPDYRSDPYHSFFQKVRLQLQKQLKNQD